MSGFFRKLFENLFNRAVYDAAKYLFFIFLAGLIWLAAHMITVNSQYMIPYAAVLSISLAAGAGLLGLLLYQRRNPVYRIYAKTDFKYIVLQKECSYEYKNRHHMLYEKRIKLKVLCKDLDRYYDKYNWSGCGQPIIRSDDKDHLILLTTKRDAFQQFEVHLSRNYKKGEIIDLHLTFELEDPEGKAIPVLSSTVLEPTTHLKLKVKIPSEFSIESADAEVFPITDSRITLEKYTLYFNNNAAVEWEISSPQMLLVYSLRWILPE